MFTKEQVLTIKKTARPYQNEDGTTVYSKFLNTDGIEYTLDGSALADYLDNLGFDILEYADLGTNGIVSFADKNGNFYRMSTNGSCRELRGVGGEQGRELTLEEMAKLNALTNGLSDEQPLKQIEG